MLSYDSNKALSPIQLIYRSIINLLTNKLQMLYTLNEML